MICFDTAKIRKSLASEDTRHELFKIAVLFLLLGQHRELVDAQLVVLFSRIQHWFRS